MKSSFTRLLIFLWILSSGIPALAGVFDTEIKGQVTGSDGTAIPGVSVTVKGTNRGVLTDQEGRYSIQVADRNAVLVFRQVGYTPVEITAGTQTVINISLEEDIQALEEVVVVGYGVVKKSDVTGAIAKIGQKEMEAMPVQNALQAMQGKTAGVDITSNERPGEIGSIRIRGERSLTATNAPLYVVDGIPLQGTGIENLNPGDIESIEVLKDASSTAIFGSRGANGVILVTTKRGKSGKMSVNYSGTFSSESMHDRMEMMNSAEWLDYSRAAKIKAGTYNGSKVISLENDRKVYGTDPYAFAQIEQGWQGGSWDGSRVPTYNWTDAGLQTALTQIHTLSASGGTEKLQSYGSFGYMDQQGTQPGQGYKRYTGKFSADFSATSWLKLGGNINVTWGDQEYGYNFRKSTTGASNLYFALQGMLPWTVPYTPDGEYIRNPGGDVNIINPIREVDYSRNQRINVRTMASLYSEVNFGKIFGFLDGLKYRFQFGPDFRYNRNGIADQAASINGDGNNLVQYNTDLRNSWTLDNLIYYNKNIGKNSLGVTLLQSASAYKSEGSNIRSFVNTADELWYNVGSLASIQGYGSYLTETQLTSYMARVNYGFDEKYLLTVSGRWDGASQLAEGYKWDFFPSAALAWRVDQESFLKEVNWVTQLKLRLGVGVTGNAGIGAYGTKGAVSNNFYHWGEIVAPGMVASDPSAASPVVMANTALGWEKTAQYNLGIDFAILKGRIDGTIDLYKSKTSDLLMEKALPALTGYLRTWDNIGKTDNKGIDISLNTVNVKTKDFRWASTLTYSADRSKIVELADGKIEDIANGWFVGRPIGSYYDYVYDGVWKTSEKDAAAKYGREPGMIKVKDLNGDGVIDANNDRAIVGKSRPDWSGGFLNTLNYKNWELSAFLYGRFGFTMRTGSETLSGRFAMRKLDYWIEGVNEDAEYYAPGVGGENGDTFKGAQGYRDGSFIKLRNVSLGYNFRPGQLKVLKVQNAKLYVQCMNPGLVYSKIDFIDPDLGGSTFNRSFVFGVNLGF
ncbi:SusC/RagA family TonB-linked outer membrane protein [Leadbetterella sp. DM7]|uniref:SusC/RagA family TonB-linked outer membrane protein n=1 Tax=Leadbetterella sp. DM7 TaxID=3235085 RepID=UPI00349E9AFD